MIKKYIYTYQINVTSTTSIEFRNSRNIGFDKKYFQTSQNYCYYIQNPVKKLRQRIRLSSRWYNEDFTFINLIFTMQNADELNTKK